VFGSLLHGCLFSVLVPGGERDPGRNLRAKGKTIQEMFSRGGRIGRVFRNRWPIRELRDYGQT
jgi:hypothetical protein